VRAASCSSVFQGQDLPRAVTEDYQAIAVRVKKDDRLRSCPVPAILKLLFQASTDQHYNHESGSSTHAGNGAISMPRIAHWTHLVATFRRNPCMFGVVPGLPVQASAGTTTADSLAPTAATQVSAAARAAASTRPAATAAEAACCAYCGRGGIPGALRFSSCCTS
jgi:hypothetical protein